jgi:hypothetical protein
MKTTVSRYDFERAFVDADRKDNFSYEALGLLFDYFEELEADLGEEIELDVIAICCEYSEDTLEDIANNYGIDLVDVDEEDQADFVRNYLEAHTTLIGETATGFVYLSF